MKQRNFNEDRIKYLDIAKGIGIFLVVYAHAMAPFESYIYQFHMPLFFLISGLLFNENNTLKEFIIRKVKGLYIPFVFWNILATLLELVKEVSIDNYVHIAKTCILIVLTLSKAGFFFGATWFLGALFVVSIGYKLLDVLLKIDNPKKKRVILVVVFLLCAIIGFAIDFPYMLSRTLICSFFYALGCCIKSYKIEIMGMKGHILAWVSFIVFVIIAHNNYANMGANDYSSPVLFVIGAFLASYFTIYISKLISKHIPALSNGLVFLGKRSIEIVIWQFIVFRIVILIQMYLDEISFSKILTYYPIYDASNGWWIIYTLVGLFASILLGTVLKKGPWGNILKKMYIVS